VATTTLCAACATCPEVVLDGDTVRVGDGNNRFTIKTEEWNVLVDVIESGKVGKV
jgi:hypothetical protein